MKKIFLQKIIVIIMCICFFANSAQYTYADEFLYTDWEMVLKECIIDGQIDLELLREKKHVLCTFLNKVSTLSAKSYNTWSRNEKCAFWLNVYNACSLFLILKNPYAETITEIKEGPNEQIFPICGNTLSLNNMKHTYLRGYCSDERVHFAMVPPAKGFPSLRNEAYVGSCINLMLEEDVVRFLKEEKNIKIDKKEKKVYVSSIFKWYGVDFVKRYDEDEKKLSKFDETDRAVINFVRTYMSEHNEFLLKGDYSLIYTDFDWRINKK